MDLEEISRQDENKCLGAPVGGKILRDYRGNVRIAVFS